MWERQQVVVKLTQHQALRCEKLGERIWPGEKLTVEETVVGCCSSICCGWRGRVG